MNIIYITFGSDGDILPTVAFGIGLKQAGHVIKIATSTNHEKLVIQWGLDFIPIEGRIKLRLFQKDFLEELWNICQGADAIIFNEWLFACSYIAEKLKIPCYIISMLPFHQTRNFPYAYESNRRYLGSIYNWLSYSFFDYHFWQSVRHPLNRWRQEVLQLPPLSRWSSILGWINQKQIPCFYSYSPAFLPKPSEWPDWVHVNGYWFLDSPVDWQPSQDLIEFLATGSPPVYIGFGFNNQEDLNSEVLIKLFLEALAGLGQRGILFMGKDLSNRIDLPEEVFPIEWVSFDWLFPQLAAVVHHGGLGTTHAALRAGIPSIIIPHDEENIFWSHRIVELGLGPPVIPQKHLSLKKLTAAIKAATSDKAMHARVTQMSTQIQAEDGVAMAVEAFHQHLY